ncbi:Mth938-like domain-containing protein [Bauldia sp.]|uniref:Mth938-like domain-containing protein n=1 Tax=Bauldia sp. TaxID=2575872 RepID=UPI003BAAF628
MAPPGIEVRAAHYPGRAPIDAYGNGGFRFADMSHRGSILCLPSGIHGWDTPEPVDAASLAKVFAEADAIDVLLVGMGAEIAFLDSDLKARLREAGIVADAMSTGAAVRTYNVLVAEDRPVAAALIAVD